MSGPAFVRSSRLSVTMSCRRMPTLWSTTQATTYWQALPGSVRKATAKHRNLLLRIPWKVNITIIRKAFSLLKVKGNASHLLYQHKTSSIKYWYYNDNNVSKSIRHPNMGYRSNQKTDRMIISPYRSHDQNSAQNSSHPS